MMFQVDLPLTSVVRPACVETTALGAAYLGGPSSGMYQSTRTLRAVKAERRFMPTRKGARAAELEMQRLEDAVRQTTVNKPFLNEKHLAVPFWMPCEQTLIRLQQYLVDDRADDR